MLYVVEIEFANGQANFRIRALLSGARELVYVFAPAVLCKRLDTFTLTDKMNDRRDVLGDITMLYHRAESSLRLGSHNRCSRFKPPAQVGEGLGPLNRFELLERFIKLEQFDLPFPSPPCKKSILHHPRVSCGCFPSFNAFA